jgi:hypothetical protein
VVAKIVSDEIAHKSDVGGVAVDLRTPAEVVSAADRFRALGATRVLVQQYIQGGTEMFLGLRSIPSLGTFILVGLGGIWAEMVHDVQIRPAGLDHEEARDMTRQLKGYPRLLGAKGHAPVNLDVVAETIMRLDAIALAAGDQIQSLDVNPLIVRGDEAIVVDALLVSTSDPAAGHKAVPES